MNIPSAPIAYWLSKNFIMVYNHADKLSNVLEAKVGLQTGDNGKFVRLWFEPCLENVFFNATDYIQAMYYGKKWFPYNKGGDFRKWYGNNEYVVNWQDNGKEIRNFVGENGRLASRPQNTQYYFRESVTWSKISSGKIAFRYKPVGHIFDVAGTSLFHVDNEKLFYALALANTNLIQYILEATSPTLNYEVGQISSLPVLFPIQNKVVVVETVKKNISISKKDWDSFETSWDFKKHPLI